MGSCVWSECAIDDTDDAYTGDNRDGDEKWYKYRTQNFCANAAYSLYGSKKGGSVSPGGCSRKHYINSYFTYGGADTLLKNLGVTPEVYYGDDENGGNAYCVELEDYEPEDGEAEDGEGDERRLERRLSGSRSNDNDEGYSSTVGCSAYGDYVISVFETKSCDGNYFLENVDTFDSYNSQHAIGCQQIMKSDGSEASSEAVTQLLRYSWTCDVRLYPRDCPDPFGQKANWEHALRTAAHGGNPVWAYKVRHTKTPMTRLY